MIIARSPLRISLGGGGTDLPSYYRGHEGFLIAAAIDKYVYVTVTRPFIPGHLPQVLLARARHAGRSDPTPDHPRGARAAEARHAADRDHDTRRHSGRDRAWLLRELHHRVVEGIARLPAQD